VHRDEQGRQLIIIFIGQDALCLLNDQNVGFGREPFIHVVEAFFEGVPALAKAFEELERRTELVHY
jgi:hypothetical protein